MHGPAAATLAAAGEAAVGSYRTSKRWTSRIVSPAMAAVAMLSPATRCRRRWTGWPCAGSTTPAAGGDVDGLRRGLLRHQHRAGDRGAAPEAQRAAAAVSDIFGMFGWVGIAYAGSATVAVLLYLTVLQSGIGVLMAMVPLLACCWPRCTTSSASRRPPRPCAAPAPRPPSASANSPSATCASSRPASGASTAPSRTPPSAWRCCPSTGRILQANPALRSLLGRSGDELLQQRFQDLVLAEDRAAGGAAGPGQRPRVRGLRAGAALQPQQRRAGVGGRALQLLLASPAPARPA
jgi:hypothetical protein